MIDSRSSHLCRVGFLALASFAFIQFASAQATLSGRVTSIATGNPVAGADIDVFRASDMLLMG